MSTTSVNPPTHNSISLHDLQELLNRWLGIKSDVSAPIIISIIIFLLGYAFNGVIRIYSDYNQRDNIRRLFKLNLTNLYEVLIKQQRNFNELTDAMKLVDGSETFVLKMEKMFHLKVITELGYRETFSAYFSGIENLVNNLFFKSKRIEAFTELWGSIEYINSALIETPDSLKTYLSIYNTNNEIRNTGLSELVQITDDLLMRAIDGEPLPEVLKYYAEEIDRIRYNWQTTANRTNPYITHWKLVLPIRIVNRALNERTVVAKTHAPLLKATLGYANMRQGIKLYQSHFSSYADGFEKNAEKIKKALSNL